MTAMVPMIARLRLERVEMLHQRDRERILNVGAILLAAAQPELENARKHPAALLTDGDRPVEVVGRDLRADLAQQALRIAMLHLKKDQTLDDDCEADDRNEQEQPHIPAALLHET